MAESVEWRLIYEGDGVRVGDYRCACRDCGLGREEHSEANEIVFPRRGVFTKHLSNRGRFVVDANHVVFFTRHEPYRISHPAAERDRCTTLYLQAQILQEVLAARDPRVADRPERPFEHSHAPSSAAAAALHAQLLRRIAADASPDLQIDELAISLAAVSVSHLQVRLDRDRNSRTRAAHLDLVEHAQVALAQTFRTNLALAKLAARVHSSPFHLARVFRRQSGHSLHGYRVRLRLRAALDQLADGNVDLTHVALDCGFFDQSHFCNAFRREFGKSPRELLRPGCRRQLREMSTNLQVQIVRR